MKWVFMVCGGSRGGFLGVGMNGEISGSWGSCRWCVMDEDVVVGLNGGADGGRS